MYANTLQQIGVMLMTLVFSWCFISLECKRMEFLYIFCIVKVYTVRASQFVCFWILFEIKSFACTNFGCFLSTYARFMPKCHENVSVWSASYNQLKKKSCNMKYVVSLPAGGALGLNLILSTPSFSFPELGMSQHSQCNHSLRNRTLCDLKGTVITM